MIKLITVFITLNLASSLAFSQTASNLNSRYQPDTYTKYDIDLKSEKLSVTVFKVNRDEPHLNPLHFDLYFQCAQNKSYYKLKRDFGEYKGEITYCGNDKPLVEKIDGKVYLSLPARLAEPETGCPKKVNRKEIFSVADLVKHCSQAVTVKSE